MRLGISASDAIQAPSFPHVWEQMQQPGLCRWVAVDDLSQRLLIGELNDNDLSADIECLTGICPDIQAHANAAGMTGPDANHAVAAEHLISVSPSAGLRTRSATHEQRRIIDLVVNDADVAVSAFAGTGKTTTLDMVARAKPVPTLALMFNKAIAQQASDRLPDHVQAQTIHSLARQLSPEWVQRKAGIPNPHPTQMASALGIEKYFEAETGAVIEPATLVALAMDAINRFCVSEDIEIGQQHLTIPAVFGDRIPLRLLERIHGIAQRIWYDISTPAGSRFPVGHNHYLKLWAMTEPALPSRFEMVMFDEAQDANPVMAGIIASQREGRQLIIVGDSAQRIYSFNGAVDMFDSFTAMTEARLTESFRFGETIAGIANVILSRLNVEHQVTGNGSLGSIGPEPFPDAYIARGNGPLYETAAGLHALGRPFSLAGAEELASFVESARCLQNGLLGSHPTLTGFTHWDQVREAATQVEDVDPHFTRLVELVDFHSVDHVSEIANASLPSQSGVPHLTTAHRSKGQEWESVKLVDDFQTDEATDPEELRVLYVAATRAKAHLDLNNVPIF